MQYIICTGIDRPILNTLIDHIVRIITIIVLVIHNNANKSYFPLNMFINNYYCSIHNLTMELEAYSHAYEAGTEEDMKGLRGKILK